MTIALAPPVSAFSSPGTFGGSYLPPPLPPPPPWQPLFPSPDWETRAPTATPVTPPCSPVVHGLGELSKVESPAASLTCLPAAMWQMPQPLFSKEEGERLEAGAPRGQRDSGAAGCPHSPSGTACGCLECCQAQRSSLLLSSPEPLAFASEEGLPAAPLSPWQGWCS